MEVPPWEREPRAIPAVARHYSLKPNLAVTIEVRTRRPPFLPPPMPLLLRSHFSRGLLLLALVIVLPAGAQTTFVITDLGNFGGNGSIANAINASGQIVGTYTDSGGVNRAFRYNPGGGVLTLDPFGGTYATANAINGSGYFVGESSPASGSGSRAFSYSSGDGMVDLGTFNNAGDASLAFGINSGGTIVGKSNGVGSGNHRAFSYTSGGGFVDLGTLGGNHSSALAINNAGVIVGGANTADSATRAFSYTTAGGMINLGSLGGGDAMAHALSPNGQFIAGYSSITGEAEKHPFLYTTAGGMIDLGTLGGIEAFAKGVNDSGAVVGVSYLPNFQEHAFYYAGDTLYDLNDLVVNRGDWTLVSANGINNLGQIVGYGVINGENHAFLLTATAIPEPSTYALFAGLACLALAAARKQRLRA
jgi:probable HAF family extracellular repeat protein